LSSTTSGFNVKHQSYLNKFLQTLKAQKGSSLLSENSSNDIFSTKFGIKLPDEIFNS